MLAVCSEVLRKYKTDDYPNEDAALFTGSLGRIILNQQKDPKIHTAASKAQMRISNVTAANDETTAPLQTKYKLKKLTRGGMVSNLDNIYSYPHYRLPIISFVGG